MKLLALYNLNNHMKQQTILKSTLCLLIAIMCSAVWAQASVSGDNTRLLKTGLYIIDGTKVLVK